MEWQDEIKGMKTGILPMHAIGALIIKKEVKECTLQAP